MRASLVDVDYDKTGKATAILRRQGTGTNLRVQVEQLSEADRAYIASMADWLRAPQSLRGRLTVESRDEVRKSAGSSAAAESAVEKALLWLTARQNPDGSWGTTYAPAMTGLALLALTGQGHGADSARYGRHIASGTAYLSALGAKNSNPFEGVLSNKPAVVTSVYEHAIATQALAEVLALAKISNTVPAGLDSVTANAERIILTAQAPNGAWGYKDGIGYDRYGANDL